MAAALRLMLRVITKVDESVVAQRGRHKNVAAMATVSPRRTPFGDELFTAERHTAVAAVAGLDSNSRFVNKHLY